MKRTTVSGRWNKCDLCGKIIRTGESCFFIEYKVIINSWGNTRYKRAYWHEKHFKIKDYSARCKEKMSCVTGSDKELSHNCEKKLCIHHK